MITLIEDGIIRLNNYGNLQDGIIITSDNAGMIVPSEKTAIFKSRPDLIIPIMRIVNLTTEMEAIPLTVQINRKTIVTAYRSRITIDPITPLKYSIKTEAYPNIGVPLAFENTIVPVRGTYSLSKFVNRTLSGKLTIIREPITIRSGRDTYTVKGIFTTVGKNPIKIVTPNNVKNIVLKYDKGSDTTTITQK